ncbi:aldehyde dehydrogenase family protein [Streptomyces sp. NPDC026672]|uniref:aldehyde dehydrogenase family protein n=1 Tax=unclassified Streptomyces TaxID=2593676 RepID=UPI0033E084B1
MTNIRSDGPEASVSPEPAPYGGLDSVFVGGSWRHGGTGLFSDNLDPWTGESVGRVARADAADVEEALASAKASQRDWADTSPAQRTQLFRDATHVLDARRTEIVEWLIREAGATRGKAEREWTQTRQAFEEAGSIAHHVEGKILPSNRPGKENRVYRVPVGVVGVISPWNLPFYLTGRAMAPAIALGNTVVVKPSEDTPVTGGLLHAKILEEAGLPKGVLHVITHAREDAAALGDTLTASDVPRVISFTGSTAVGRHITRTAGIKRLALELGGNAPVVVLGDADLEQAVDGAAYSAYANQGQICTSGNRLIVEAPIYDAFIERFVERVKDLPYGDPSDPKTFVGPVINRRQLEGIRAKISRARESGATVLLGGDPVGPAGLVLPPTVVLGDSATPTAREEVFGPVITILRAEDESDALRLANDTEYGLSSAVFTRDLDRGVRFAQRVEAGMSHVNDASAYDEPHMPFGGEKNSGVGRSGGEWIVDEYTTPHWISIQHTPAPRLP